ncbi:N2227-like protein, putative [Plasmodium knowlesi strain H]|uniref:carnosine N-methyltransferase n=3 Tax=Plasmodium knowlesi TaxID=5850 RepID=A0A5K1V4K5_PLAKH|nr:N2227-like protein, putative [Plasmodium knowlesi strain H]OTN65942.1 putative N2227-like protein [Plasmodium knowlesi]CAA9987974.1 N2227-like protein, putative [Plasmodium knowlesi strain H]SBO22121.1 N2227-like protein, putative [Plasmodium knowlesi strain H]SBO29169.1 N2227-like protein, putative [Plasmodium knowlesi strain H]VVS77448.1 N2227-like protein, putative [Plasmodium knowlesi strain H]|eukprot:XP_002258953.1 N2227-like protein, putative [Plasmodium knowlesi strain H]
MPTGTKEENEAKPPGGHCGKQGECQVGVRDNNSRFPLLMGGCNPCEKCNPEEKCNPCEKCYPEESNPEREESHNGCTCTDYPGRTIPGKGDYLRDDYIEDNIDTLGDEEERHFCNICFSFLYYKKHSFYELLRIYRNFSSLTPDQKTLLDESIYSKIYKMYLGVLNNYFFIFNILVPQISTHIILHLLAHTAHRGDVVIVEDSGSDGEEEDGGKEACDGSNASDERGAEDVSHYRNTQGKKIIPREEYTINEILKNLTEEEKDKIDREYNYYNLDARLLCKDDPIIILKEIRSKLISAKEDEGISRELDMNLERSTSADYLDVGYSSGGKMHHRDETSENPLGSSSLFPQDQEERTHAEEKQQRRYFPQEGQQGNEFSEENEEECRESQIFPQHYNEQYHNKEEKKQADSPNGKGKSEDARYGGTMEQKCNLGGEEYIADHRKENSEYAFPRLDYEPGEVRLGEWRGSDGQGGEKGASDTNAPGEVISNISAPISTPAQGEHFPPGRRITSAYNPTLDEYNLLQNMGKVRSTLRQFVRDWSLEGKHERDSAYEPMLKSLDKYLPITDSYVPKVLCPGSGLGRLPYEVAKKGYRSQGNEFSYFMLLASNFILNYYNEKESLKIQPYCLNTLNRRKRDDHLKVVTLPDINTYNKAILSTDFSMCAGELIEVYDKEKESFDGVLTCFFMDTAKNIFLYIRTFANILKPNSLWCNVGPLLYHYSEMTNELSIELSWEEIEVIISKWFTLVETEWIDNYYTTNVDSMMQVQYHCIFFCAIRNDVPVEDPPMDDPLQVS